MERKTREALMLAWDAEVLRWYSEASAYCAYHKDLAARLLQRLGPCDSVYDLGAGSGDLALILAQKGLRVIAVEQQNLAAEYIKQLARAAAPGRLEVICGDWTRLEGPPACAAILSYCGRVNEHWNALRRLCQKRLIVLASAGAPRPLINLPGMSARRAKKKPDTPASIRAALKRYGASFSEEAFQHEFGQIFRNREDLQRFLCQYYGEEAAARLDEAEALCTRLAEGRLYAPSQRRSVLFLVNMTA